MKAEPNPHIFLFAGERSGDLHGGHLLKALQQQLPNAVFSGVAGPEMRKSHIQPVLRMEDFEVMGFTDVLFALPKLWQQFRHVRDHILHHKPQGVVLVDYPGFNLRLAKALRQRGYNGKIIQYVSPTVWAYGQKRIEALSAHMDLLMTIYPFEEKYYAHCPLKVRYVGNPLCEYIKKTAYQDDWKEALHMPKDNPILAIFPGSREGEIARNFPIQLEAAERLWRQNRDKVVAVSCSASEHRGPLEKLLSGSSLVVGKHLFFVPGRFTYELMRDSRTAIAKSGTVTLELALHRCPTVVTYKLTPLNRFIAAYVLKLNLPYYCIVNILAEKEVFPELIAEGFTADTVAHKVSQLDREGPQRQQCITDCGSVAASLAVSDASHRAAQAVIEAIL